MTDRQKAHVLLSLFSDEQIEAFLTIFKDCYEIPNEETLEAFLETEEMIKHPEKYKSYSSVEEMINDIINEE